MATDQPKLWAVAGTGVIVVLGLTAITLTGNPAVPLLGLCYVAAVSISMAAPRTRTVPVLCVAWLVAYGAAAVASAYASGSVGWGLGMGAVLATVFVVGWMALAFFLLLAIDPARRRVVP